MLDGATPGSGVFSALKKGTLVIDCSTIAPATSRALSATGAALGLRVLDAPVSGGVGGAEAGTLTLMVGGSAPDFEAAKAVLGAVGRSVVHCGGPGTGQIAKLVNNHILGCTMVAVAEGFALGVALGADPATLQGVVNSSSGRCWSSEVYNPVPGVLPGVPSSRGYSGGFGSALMAKDLGLSLEAARSVGLGCPAGGAAHATFSVMSKNGLATKDFSSVYAWLKGERLA